MEPGKKFNFFRRIIMSVKFKVNNSWRDLIPKVRVSGEWKDVVQIWVKVNGTWRKSYTYTWDVGEWSACSEPCGGGVMTRDVKCLRDESVYVDDSICEAYEE